MILTKPRFVQSLLSRKRLDPFYVPRECFLTLRGIHVLRPTSCHVPPATSCRRTLIRTAKNSDSFTAYLQPTTGPQSILTRARAVTKFVNASRGFPARPIPPSSGATVRH